MKYTILGCPKCGDDSIHRDATAEWDILQGSWELAGVQDNFACSACGAEFRSPTEIDAIKLFGDACLIAGTHITIVLRPVRFVGDAFERCEPGEAQGWRVYWRKNDDDRDDDYAQNDMYLVTKRTREDAEGWARHNVFVVANNGEFLVETKTTRYPPVSVWD